MAKNNTNKPLLLFGPIFDFTVEAFIDKLNEIPENEDVNVWLNSPGGSVFAGWSLIGAMKKRTGKTNISVFGNAASMAFIFMMFGDTVEALDVTKFLVHRASGYVETPEDQQLLDSINKDLRQKLEKKLDKTMFQEVTGVSFDEVFDGENVKDVWISAKDAKKMGLISSIKRLSPDEIKAYNNSFVAFYNPLQGSQGPQGSDINSLNDNTNINHNLKTMTKDEFKAAHPSVYAAIVAEGHTAGITAERERVKSWMAFVDIDKDNVITSVKEGKEFATSVIAEMTVKITASKTLEAINKDNAKDTKTDEADNKTADQKEAEAFEKEVAAGVKKINLI